MRFKIKCTFICEVEAADMDIALSAANDVFILNENYSDAVISRDENYEMEAWEMEDNNATVRN